MLGGVCERMTVRSDNTAEGRSSDTVQSVALTLLQLRDPSCSLFTEISVRNPQHGGDGRT
jgi:hypothetical protein